MLGARCSTSGAAESRTWEGGGTTETISAAMSGAATRPNAAVAELAMQETEWSWLVPCPAPS